jgi:hypothetical protein
LAIWKNKSFKIWRIWAIFFIKNPLYRLKSYFSGQSLAKFRPIKNDASKGWKGTFGNDEIFKKHTSQEGNK